MEATETMPIDGRKLIIKAAGGFRPGERIQQLLYRVAAETGIGPRSMEQFWKGQYGSKRTIFKLTQKATERAATLRDQIHQTWIKTIEAELARLEHEREMALQTYAANDATKIEKMDKCLQEARALLEEVAAERKSQ